MLCLLFGVSSFAGVLVVDARVPAEVQVGGQPVVQLFQPGVVRLDWPSGPSTVTVLVGGTPQDVPITMTESGTATILVGKTGITTGQRATAEPSATGTRKIEFSTTGTVGMLLIVDDARHVLASGDVLTLDLPDGNHKIALRDQAGTVIWARGSLIVGGAGPDAAIVQLSEGRMPEGSDGARFQPDTH
jgi:hypothetical protein